MLRRIFTDHPRAVGESYSEHALVAARFGSAMVAGGIACLVHAVVPALFARTGSDTVRRLHGAMTRRHPLRAPAPVPTGQLFYEI